jgi:hypothetical protein
MKILRPIVYGGVSLWLTTLIALAANAPSYHNSNGDVVGAQGVVLIDKTTGEPYNSTGGGGGTGTGGDVNVTAINGTTVSTGAGLKDAGTQRIVIATDQTSLTNALKVDGSAVTQPVAGTVAATQSGGWSVGQTGAWSVGQSGAWNVGQTGTWNVGQTGTWTVQPGNTPNTVPWKVDLSGTGANATALKVDGSAVTQPVSGIVTVVQGTPSNLKVDLSGTGANTAALKVDGSATTQPVSGSVTVAQATAANLKVDLSGTAANTTALKVDGSGAVQPVSGSVAVSGAVNTNLTSLNGVAVDTNSGVKSGGTQRVILATDQPSLTNALKVDGSAVTQPISGSVAITGTPAVSISGTLSTNLATVANTTVDTNSGLKSAGTQRFVLATDQPQLTNALKVDGSAVTQPISGTVTVSQPTAANLKVDLSGTAANATAIKVDNSGVTQPISGAVTVSSGAETVSQPTAGNLNAQVIGNTAAGSADVGKPVKIGGVYNTTLPTYTNGTRGDAQIDVNGQLRTTDTTTQSALATANGYLSTLATNSSDSNPSSVSIASDLVVHGYGSGWVSMTRPANTTAYTGNDVIGPASGTSAWTFPVAAGQGEYMITRVQLRIDDTGLIAGETSYNLFCYDVTPPSALTDNSAFDIPTGDRAALMAKISVGTPIDEGSTLYIEQDGINAQVSSLTGNIFCYLVTVGAYTPTSGRVYNMKLHTVRIQ